jgi:hypothetical protein
MNYNGSRCANCSSGSTVTVTVPASQPGRHLRMTSCLRCEHRAWSSDEGVVSMPNVLREISGRVDFALMQAPRPQRRSTRKAQCNT